MNEIKKWRVTKAISQIRKVLNNYGRMNNLPRSAACVDEDFHYMRDRNGADDDSQRNSLQSWPEHFVFEARNFMMTELNPTSSLTSRTVEIEKLKACLFMDPYESQSQFVNLRCDQLTFMTNEDEYFCCECEYTTKFPHYVDTATNVSESALQYLTSTCPICILNMAKSCSRNKNACCVKRMENRDGFINI